ncbi:ANTAR domain-containing protein [Streptomyces sp. IBSBF 3136]|uniref:ANTAR domain-containing protein n=1 Tax=Streptomyces sp. IBSBF 3136 TaxID=2903524 RepID=UPI002FDBDD85
MKLFSATDPVGHELERSEHARLRRTLAARATINMAEGALAVLGSLPIEDACLVLTDVARRLRVDAHLVAEHVLNMVQGVAVPGTVYDELHHVLDAYGSGGRSAADRVAE